MPESRKDVFFVSRKPLAGGNPPEPATTFREPPKEAVRLGPSPEAEAERKTRMIGVNLNQIARALNSGASTPAVANGAENTPAMSRRAARAPQAGAL